MNTDRGIIELLQKRDVILAPFAGRIDRLIITHNNIYKKEIYFTKRKWLKKRSNNVYI